MEQTPPLVWLLVYITIAMMFGALGAYTAWAKKRTETEGFFLGFLFGPLGVIVVGLLPNNDKRPKRWLVVDPPNESTSIYRNRP